MQTKRTKDDLNFPQTARCSECGHQGELFINDEHVRNELNKAFKEIAGRIVIRKFFIYTAFIYIIGLVCGSFFIG